jgi:signal peptidase
MVKRSLALGSISKGIVKDFIIVAIGIAIIWFGLQIVFGTPNPFYVVSSGSMVPQLEIFDVLVVQGSVPFEEIQIDDVIVFDRPSDHDRVIVHRVVSVIEDEPLTLRTKGDANPASIPGTDFPITEEEYLGKVAYVIPQIGYITRILTPPVNYIIIGVIIGIMIIKQIIKKKKQKDEFVDPFAESEDGVDIQNSFEQEKFDRLPIDNEYNIEKDSELEKKDSELEKKDSELEKKDSELEKKDSDN